MNKIRLTNKPDETIEVNDRELENLTAQGLVVDETNKPDPEPDPEPVADELATENRKGKASK